MDITKIDKNFLVNEVEIDGDKQVYILPAKEISLYGTVFEKEVGAFQRMPSSIAKQVTYNIEVLSSTTAGARARFSTNASEMVLSVKYRYLAHMSNMTRNGASGFTLMIESEEEGNKWVGHFAPLNDDLTGFSQSIKLSGDKIHDYTLYFPLYNDYIEEIKIAFNKDAVVLPGRKYFNDLPILYYGSSITQGGCASRPDNCYQGYISKWHNADYLNLGFSGGAKGEDVMVEYLASIKSKVFVCDYDANAPDAEHLRKTHYKVYKAYRDANPDTPIVLISLVNIREGTFERREVIKNTYKRAKKEGDKNVYFIDGSKIFGKQDRENCTVDGCHPNDLGFYRMAKVIDRTLAPLLK